MGLDYQEQEEISEDVRENEETVDEQRQNVQPIAPVTPYYSIILVSSIIIVWLFQIGFATAPPQIPDVDRSVLLAGFVKPLFLNGEYWRILTAGALHAGLLHLAFNSYALYVLGKAFEFLSNRSHLAIVFILSIIGGGFMSLIFLPDPSVGASGGIIGFLGYLTVYGFKRRKILSNSFLKNMLFNIALIAGVGFLLRDTIDNFGHLGGLIVGLVYGFIQIPSDLYKDPREVGSVTKTIGYIALGIFILTCIFTILLLTGVIGFNYDFLLQ